MKKEYKQYPDISPVPALYSRAVKAGDLFFIAGCTAGGSDAEQGSLPDQLREALRRIKAILEVEGQAMNDVVKLTTFVTDVNEWVENRAANNAMFEEMFDGNYPTNTLIGCAALVRPSLKIEIETTCVF